jgi:putative addiction module component (TIGR02574 family)
MDYKELRHEALKLPSDEKVELAYALFRSLDEAESREIKTLWLEEAERRYQEYLDGGGEAVSGEEGLRRIRAARR